MSSTDEYQQRRLFCDKVKVKQANELLIRIRESIHNQQKEKQFKRKK